MITPKLVRQVRGALVAQWILTGGQQPQMSLMSIGRAMGTNPRIGELEDALNALVDSGEVEYEDVQPILYTATAPGVRKALMSL